MGLKVSGRNGHACGQPSPVSDGTMLALGLVHVVPGKRWKAVCVVVKYWWDIGFRREHRTFPE